MSTIKEKIQKMLELAKRGGTEAEAETAMRMVLEALAKHNLNMSDVEDTAEEDEDVIEVSTDGSKFTWQGILWNALSELYFCQVYSKRYRLNGKDYKSFVLVGRKSNVETAKSVITYLIQLGEELSQGGDTLYRNSFKNGYSHRIAERCREEKRKATDNKLIGNADLAPMIINLYAVTKTENHDYLAAKGVRLVNRAISTNSRDANGYNAGRDAGGKVSLRNSAQGRLN